MKKLFLVLFVVVAVGSFTTRNANAQFIGPSTETFPGITATVSTMPSGLYKVDFSGMISGIPAGFNVSPYFIISTGPIIPGPVGSSWTTTGTTVATRFFSGYPVGIIAPGGTFTASYLSGTVPSSSDFLHCNTVYHYMFQGRSDRVGTLTVGYFYSPDQTFTTPVCLPSVTTDAATLSSITATSATINGTVTDLGGASVVSAAGFQLTTDASFVSGGWYGAVSVPLSTSITTVPSTFYKNVTGLSCNTTYHFRAYATNYIGTTSGSGMTFTTLPCGSPSVATISALPLGATSAVLEGMLTGFGGGTGVVVGFDYGLSSSYGSTTPTISFPSLGYFTRTVTGLTCGTTYNYRATATSSAGGATGANATFTTASCSSLVTWIGALTVSFADSIGYGFSRNDDLSVIAADSCSILSTGGQATGVTGVDMNGSKVCRIPITTPLGQKLSNYFSQLPAKAVQ